MVKHSKLADLPLLPVDPIYSLQTVFKNDPRAHKINLSIGVCKNKEKKTYFFKAVELAEGIVHAEPPSYDYLPLTGHAAYCEATKELVCGQRESVLATQTVGGTGALYVAARLLRSAKMYSVFVPQPTWTNHIPLFSQAGLDVATYPYYNRKEGSVAFAAMCDSILKMPEQSALVLQASCHNPTGIDIHPNEFHTLSQLVREKRLYPIFDLAYQGLGKGLAEDTKGISIFLDDGHEMMIAATFAKSFGLYNDRPAALFINAPKDSHTALLSHFQIIARSCYSSPPAHGAKLIATILKDARLKRLWEKELEEFRERLSWQRNTLYKAMKAQNVRFEFEHLLHTNGLFCLFALDPTQVEKLRDEEAIYLAHDGRICLSAIDEENVEHIAKALANVS